MSSLWAYRGRLSHRYLFDGAADEVGIPFEAVRPLLQAGNITATASVGTPTIPVQFLGITATATVGTPSIPDNDPPFLEEQNPAEDETDVAPSTSVLFRVTDERIGVDVTALAISYFIEDDPDEIVVFSSGVFAPTFSGSVTDVFGNQLSYDVAISLSERLPFNARITFVVQVADLQPIPNTAELSYSFFTEGESEELVPPPVLPILRTTEDPFPYDLFRFFLFEIRRNDLQGSPRPGTEFLKRYLRGPNAVWQQTIADIQRIPQLWDIEEIPDDKLQYLKAIVGWTDAPLLKKITDAIDDDSLRRLISVSARMWKTRGPEDAILDVLRILTVARARIWNWFDFRWVLDETEMGEEHEGRDPWVIDLPGDASDEYMSNLRIVDNGNLDRDLVKRILRLMRAAGERFEISYLLFLDLFETDEDDLQWNEANEMAVEENLAKLLDDGIAQSTYVISDGAVAWDQYVLSVRFRGNSAVANARFGLMFYRTNASNYYSVLVDTFSQELRLRKTVAGVTTNITTVDLGAISSNMLADIFYTLRIAILVEGATNRITVTVDGSELISTTDSALVAGSVGFMHDASAYIEVDEVEVFSLIPDTETLEINVNP